MNKQIIQTNYTVTVCQTFARWLREQMALGSWSDGSLATEIDMDRKTVLAWRLGQRYPKLDQIARLMEIFGLESLTLSVGED